MNDTALAALQRSLSENREAKRKIQARLAEIEGESASLRSQISLLDTMIEQTEHVLLQMLFPALQQQVPSPASHLHSSVQTPPAHAAHSALHQSFRSREANADTDID